MLSPEWLSGDAHFSRRASYGDALWQYRSLLSLPSLGSAVAQASSTRPQVKTADGVIEGDVTDTGIQVYRGIAFAAPPVRELRWKAPQPVQSWTGTRSPKRFGASWMQRPIYGDMDFRSNGMSEDCLFLNVWTPKQSAGNRTVLVYFFGGGLDGRGRLGIPLRR